MEAAEAIRQVTESVTRMDAEGLIAVTDPDVEWFSFLAQLGERGGYRGHDGIRAYTRDVADAWERFDAELLDTLVVGDVALAVCRLRFRGKGSGVDSETLAGYVLRFRGGLITSMRAVRDPEDAFARLGEPQG